MSLEPRRCQRCDAEIPAERIEILPDTLVCVTCSREMGGEFTVTVVPENVGKAGSLKKNYGSWNIKKTRRPIRREQD